LIQAINQKFYDPVSKSRALRCASLGVFTDMSHIDTAFWVFLTSSPPCPSSHAYLDLDANERSGTRLNRFGGAISKRE